MLELKDITVAFQDGQEKRTVLDHLDFTAKPGEMTFIVGESGSGKSTLLSVAAGLITPDSGTAQLNGVDVDDDVRRDKIGMIFQQFNLFSSRTAAGNIEYPLKLAGVDKKERERRVAELLDFVGLGERGEVLLARNLAIVVAIES